MMEAKKILLLVLNFTSVFFFSGIIFGWTALRDLLLEEGFYTYKCKEGAELPCDDQLLALNWAFTIASAVTAFAALPTGWMLDKFGPIVTVMVAGILSVTSLLCMAVLQPFFHKYQIDVFPLLLASMALAGSFIQFCSYSCAFLFPEHKELLIAMASVLFDGSCLVFPLLKVVYHAGVGFSELFAMYTAFSVVVFILLPTAWFLNRREAAASRGTEEAQEEADPAAEDATQRSAALVALHEKPIWRQMLTFEFLVIFLFSCVEQTHSNLYIGTVNAINEYIGDVTGKSDAQVSLVNTIVSFIIPLGFIAVPAITFSTKRFGPAGSLQVTSSLAMAFTALQLVPNLYLQVLAVILFATFRAFLFSTIPTFNSHYFGVLKMGRMQGFCFIGGGLVSLTQSPLVTWTVQSLNGDFVPLLCIVLSCSAVLLLLSGLFICRERHQASVREVSSSSSSNPASRVLVLDGENSSSAQLESPQKNSNSRTKDVSASQSEAVMTS